MTSIRFCDVPKTMQQTNRFQKAGDAENSRFVAFLIKSQWPRKQNEISETMKRTHFFIRVVACGYFLLIEFTSGKKTAGIPAVWCIALTVPGKNRVSKQSVLGREIQRKKAKEKPTRTSTGRSRILYSWIYLKIAVVGARLLGVAAAVSFRRIGLSKRHLFPEAWTEETVTKWVCYCGKLLWRNELRWNKLWFFSYFFITFSVSKIRYRTNWNTNFHKLSLLIKRNISKCVLRKCL